MNGRLFAVGDIHGCHSEFAELLARLSLTKDDRLVLLGDLINRGPDSCKVIDLARENRAISLLGNHELRFLKHRRTGEKKYLKEGDAETFKQLRPDDWTYLENMRLHFEVPELNTVFVHGGFLPDQPSLWADLWSGPPFVIYGHTPRPEVYKLKWSLGLDTDCVRGGSLTAYEVTEKRFLHVKARQRYWS
jgi:serine/threonine protein phosphatase 1